MPPARVSRVRDLAARMRSVLLPGRSLAVFLGALLLVLGILSLGNHLSDGASHAVRLHNLVTYGSLEIREIPSEYFTHEQLFQRVDGTYVTTEPGAVGYLSLPAWIVLRAGSVLSLRVFLPLAWSGLAYGWMRTEPAIRDRLPRHGAAPVAAGLFGVNLALGQDIAFVPWGAMLAVQATNAVAVALGVTAVHRIVEARTGEEGLGPVAAAVFLVGPVAFWAMGAKDHALGVAGPAVAMAAFYGYHRTGRTGYRLGCYAVLAATVWGAGPYGLIALAGIGLVDLVRTLRRPRRSRAREVGLVVVLGVLAALPYPIEAGMAGSAGGGPALPPADDPGGGGAGDGGGTGGGGDGADGGAPDGGGDGLDLRLTDPLARLLDPILRPAGTMLDRWIEAPAEHLASLLAFLWSDEQGLRLPILAVSPALVAALARLLPSAPAIPGRVSAVLAAPEPSRDRIADVGLAVFGGLIVLVYVPWTAGLFHVEAFDHRFLLPLYLPLSFFGVVGLADDLAGRTRRTMLLACVASLVLLATVVPLLWVSGLGDTRHLLTVVRGLGLVVAPGLVGAIVHDRLRGGSTLPYALALAVATSALWLFATTVAFGRGAYWLGATGALHEVLI